MLPFPSQNDKNCFVPTGRDGSKKQSQVTASQHIFKPGLITF